MSKSVFVTRPIPEAGLAMLRARGYEVEVNPNKIIPTQADIIGFLQKKPYDAVLTLLTDPINVAVYDAAPTVKLYANYATGYDNIDIVEAKKRGITVANAPAPQTSESVAEHTLALALALAARIVEADESVRRGEYKGWDPMNFIGMDILGTTLGLIGAGRIGARVAHYATGLGMKVLYTDIKRNEDVEKEGAIFCATPEELLPQADIVSIHVPLLPSTQHLMNDARFKLMKPSAFLVNTARGPIVDEAALEKALREKTIAGAALDVFEFEPKVAPGLLAMPNIILTPHIASASIETRNEMATITAQNIIDFFEGRQPKFAVNA